MTLTYSTNTCQQMVEQLFDWTHMAMSFFPRPGATRMHTFWFLPPIKFEKSIRPSSLHLRLQNWFTNPESSEQGNLFGYGRVDLRQVPKLLLNFEIYLPNSM